MQNYTTFICAFKDRFKPYNVYKNKYSLKFAISFYIFAILPNYIHEIPQHWSKSQFDEIDNYEQNPPHQSEHSAHLMYKPVRI